MCSRINGHSFCISNLCMLFCTIPILQLLYAKAIQMFRESERGERSKRERGSLHIFFDDIGVNLSDSINFV